MEESDVDRSVEWTDFDLSRSSNEFKGPPSNVFPIDIQIVEDVMELFIGKNLFEFINT